MFDNFQDMLRLYKKQLRKERIEQMKHFTIREDTRTNTMHIFYKDWAFGCWERGDKKTADHVVKAACRLMYLIKMYHEYKPKE